MPVQKTACRICICLLYKIGKSTGDSYSGGAFCAKIRVCREFGSSLIVDIGGSNTSGRRIDSVRVCIALVYAVVGHFCLCYLKISAELSHDSIAYQRVRCIGNSEICICYKVRSYCDSPSDLAICIAACFVYCRQVSPVAVVVGIGLGSVVISVNRCGIALLAVGKRIGKHLVLIKPERIGNGTGLVCFKVGNDNAEAAFCYIRCGSVIAYRSVCGRRAVYHDRCDV